MSRIGKQPVALPSGVTVAINGRTVLVKGPRGELQQTFHPNVQFFQDDGRVTVGVLSPNEKRDRALWGLSRMLLMNMVRGVTEGYSKILEVHGIGYRVQMNGRTVILHLGYSHPVEYALHEGIEAKVDGAKLTISGIDKQLVGETAAQIRSFRKPEPYKGKGIRYADETVRRKAGKVMKAAE